MSHLQHQQEGHEGPGGSVTARVLPVAVPVPEGGGRKQRPDAGGELRQRVHGQGLAEDVAGSEQAPWPGREGEGRVGSLGGQ